MSFLIPETLFTEEILSRYCQYSSVRYSVSNEAKIFEKLLEAAKQSQTTKTDSCVRLKTNAVVSTTTPYTYIALLSLVTQALTDTLNWSLTALVRHAYWYNTTVSVCKQRDIVQARKTLHGFKAAIGTHCERNVLGSNFALAASKRGNCGKRSIVLRHRCER